MFAWLRRPKIHQQPQALPAACIQAMAGQLLASPYLTQNVLNQRFSTTQGFSLIFQQVAQLQQHLPEVMPFFELLQDAPANLYYLNVLAIGQQGQVERHVDHSIRGYDPDLPLPRRVSVLYLQVPPGPGGELQLFDHQGRPQHTLKPQTGLLVHFPGDLPHAVQAVQTSQTLRLSLVCEQYWLSAAQLLALPEVTLKSTAGFDTFLQQHLD
ncbi:MAG: 2OG-Fe(II) oxygenase [Candidatus Sericytochromatia bacterium]|nr:2OG-Fe(II) oxygenase [Candidatus Sericytochromatia bacterium]